MIRITRAIAIDESEIEEKFVLASGPGGQNVNKVATAVQLRFRAEGSPNLPPDMLERLKRLAGKRMTADGELVIEARRYRSQERNRQDARDRLIALLRGAAQKPVMRKKTRPSLAVKRRRVENKRRRGVIKRGRGKSDDE